MSQVVKIAVNASHDLQLRWYIRIHRGPIDDDLEWPFNGMLTCQIFHPVSPVGVRKSVFITNQCPKISFGRPVYGKNSPYLIYEGNARILEDKSLIVDDTLSLKIEHL